MLTPAPYVSWLADIDTTDHSLNHHIKKIAGLRQAMFPIAPGFVITENAYFQFLQENKLDYKIKQLLSSFAIDRPDSLMQIEKYSNALFEQATFSDELLNSLLTFYNELGDDVSLEMYSTGKEQIKHYASISATPEDFLTEIKQAWAKLFLPKALWQRHYLDIDHHQTGAIILVQIALPLNKTGKVFTIGKNAHAKDQMTIVTNDNDEYIISKKNLTILNRSLKNQTKLKLTHDELLAIASLAKTVEEHLFFPQEIDWTFIDGIVCIKATRPITQLPQVPKELKTKLPKARGTKITRSIGTGVIKIITNSKEYNQITKSHIVIVPEVNVKHFKQLKNAKGIVSESGHPNSPIATLLRKQGIPTIFNVINATKQFKNGHIITIHADKAEIYQGGFTR